MSAGKHSEAAQADRRAAETSVGPRHLKREAGTVAAPSGAKGRATGATAPAEAKGRAGIVTAPGSTKRKPGRDAASPSKGKHGAGAKAQAGKTGAPAVSSAKAERKAGTGKGKAASGAKKKKRRGSAADREARRIVRHSLAAAAVLVALLGVLSLYRPQINLARAHRYVERQEIDKALTLLDQMVRTGYREEDIAGVRYRLGEYYLGLDDYAEVYALLEELPKSDERSRDLRLRTQYREAAALLEDGQIEAAAQQFYQLGDYSDSASRYDDARTAIAVRTYLDGDEEAARHLFVDIENAGAHVAEAARLLAGGDAAEAARIAGMEAFDAAALEEARTTYWALNAAHAESAGTRIAAGYRHTVGLRDDGLVLAAGDNSVGQCDVGQWSDVIQIAAGAAHTVGLRLDGTVLATGDNSFGQCDVSGWTGITAVAANAFGTVGLRSDGSVVGTRAIEEKLAGWHDITWVAGGSYSVGCLYGQGSMLSSHKAAQLDMASAVSGLAICGAVSAGIGPDGALVSSFEGAPDWRDLSQVAVTQTGLLAVTGDGRALSFLFREAGEQQLPVEGQAVEICGSGTHAVVLTADGHVYAFGKNGYGQCDVGDWRL